MVIYHRVLLSRESVVRLFKVLEVLEINAGLKVGYVQVCIRRCAAVDVLDFFRETFLKNINDFPRQKGRRLDGQRPVGGDIDLDVNITEIDFVVLRFAYTYKE